MTGQGIIDKALIELASEGSRLLETGRTLQQELQDALNAIVVDDIPVRWPFQFLVGSPASTVATVAGTDLYTVPSGMLEIVEATLDTGAIDARPMTKRPLRTFRKKWANKPYLAQDKPTEYTTVNETTFEVAPIPNAVYTIRMAGTFKPATITVFSTEVTAIPSRYHQTVAVYGVAGFGALKLHDQALAKEKLAMYDAGIQKMIVEDKREPDVEYELRPYRATGTVYTTNYWQSPFVRSVE